MNQERPTPKTDAIVRRIAESGHYSAAILEVVDADVSRNLERELNQAREELADYKSSVERTTKLISDTVEKAIRERDEARELARELRGILEAVLPFIGAPDAPEWACGDSYFIIRKANQLLP